MSRDFGVNDNNSGSFSFDDDSDLDQLLELASQGEVDSDESGDDDSVIFDDSDLEFVEEEKPAAPAPKKSSTRGKRKPETVAVVEEEIQEEPEPVYEDSGNFDDNNTSVDLLAEEVVPEPVKTEPATVDSSKTVRGVTQRPIIRKEADLVEEASKIIRVLDVYRGFSSDVKGVVTQFVYNDNEVDIEDEATLVVKVIGADSMLGRTMSNFRESASQKDRVERVFFILRLPEDELESLGALTTTLTGVEFENPKDRIGFSKDVEAAIDTLDSKIVQYVQATETLLNSANN